MSSTGNESAHRYRPPSAVPRKARVDDDQRGVVIVFRLHRPAETHRMGFGGVTAHHHHDVGVFDIHPVVGHRTATKCWSKTLLPLVRVRRAPGCLPPAYPAIAQIFALACRSPLLAAEAQQHAGGKPAVNRHRPVHSFHKVGVAVGFHQSGDAVKGFILWRCAAIYPSPGRGSCG